MLRQACCLFLHKSGWEWAHPTLGTQLYPCACIPPPAMDELQCAATLKLSAHVMNVWLYPMSGWLVADCGWIYCETTAFDDMPAD